MYNTHPYMWWTYALQHQTWVAVEAEASDTEVEEASDKEEQATTAPSWQPFLFRFRWRRKGCESHPGIPRLFDNIIGLVVPLHHYDMSWSGMFSRFYMYSTGTSTWIHQLNNLFSCLGVVCSTTASWGNGIHKRQTCSPYCFEIVL